MLRRQCLQTLIAAGFIGVPRFSFAAEKKPRFRSAICAYSFREKFKDGSFSYADLIRLAADLGVDGIDLTTYWLPDTSDRTLLPLKQLAYRSAVSIYTIGIRAGMA